MQNNSKSQNPSTTLVTSLKKKEQGAEKMEAYQFKILKDFLFERDRLNAGEKME